MNLKQWLMFLFDWLTFTGMETSSKRPIGERRKEKVDWSTIPAFEIHDVKLSDHNYLDAESLNAFSIGMFTRLFKDDKEQV